MYKDLYGCFSVLQLAKFRYPSSMTRLDQSHLHPLIEVPTAGIEPSLKDERRALYSKELFEHLHLSLRHGSRGPGACVPRITCPGRESNTGWMVPLTICKIA
jgi:hypothetical protein